MQRLQAASYNALSKHVKDQQAVRDDEEEARRTMPPPPPLRAAADPAVQLGVTYRYAADGDCWPGIPPPDPRIPRTDFAARVRDIGAPPSRPFARTHARRLSCDSKGSASVAPGFGQATLVTAEAARVRADVHAAAGHAVWRACVLASTRIASSDWLFGLPFMVACCRAQSAGTQCSSGIRRRRLSQSPRRPSASRSRAGWPSLLLLGVHTKLLGADPLREAN